MTIEKSVTKAIQQFEKNTPISELKRLDEVHNLFEKMVSEGLVNRPTYDLAPISTLPTEVNMYFSQYIASK